MWLPCRQTYKRAMQEGDQSSNILLHTLSEAISKQMTWVTSTAVCQRPSSRWFLINSLTVHERPFKSRIPFRAKNAFLGLECPFRPKMPFRARMPFRATNFLSGRRCPCGTRIIFQTMNDLSDWRCPFRPRLPFRSENSLTGHKQQSAVAGIAYPYLLIPPCALGLIKQTESTAKAVCHGIIHGILTAKSTERS